LFGPSPGVSERWAYPNLRGDLLKTASGTGVVDSQVFRWDAGGALIVGGVQPNLQASNLENGWLGQHQRMTDTTDAANPIVEMGACVYLPRLAKFTAPDPVEGGVGDADYLYPTDPINGFDLDGRDHDGTGCRQEIVNCDNFPDGISNVVDDVCKQNNGAGNPSMCNNPSVDPWGIQVDNWGWVVGGFLLDLVLGGASSVVCAASAFVGCSSIAAIFSYAVSAGASCMTGGGCRSQADLGNVIKGVLIERFAYTGGADTDGVQLRAYLASNPTVTGMRGTNRSRNQVSGR
jgi:hypothetical protein